MTRPSERAAWLAEPLTPNQLGAIHGEFRRLGFGPADRAERLAATALAPIPAGIESTRDLAAGDTGRVIGERRQSPSGIPAPGPRGRGLTGPPGTQPPPLSP